VASVSVKGGVGVDSARILLIIVNAYRYIELTILGSKVVFGIADWKTARYKDAMGIGFS
jgi:hypothetical protein